MPQDTLTRIASFVSAAAAIAGGVFAFLNWKRAATTDKPYAWLENTKPDGNCLVRTKLKIENRGHDNIVVPRAILDFGGFAGEPLMSDGGEWFPGPMTGERERLINLAVPSKQTQATYLEFYTDGTDHLVSANLQKKGGVFSVVITAARTGHTG